MEETAYVGYIFHEAVRLVRLQFALNNGIKVCRLFTDACMIVLDKVPLVWETAGDTDMYFITLTGFPSPPFFFSYYFSLGPRQGEPRPHATACLLHKQFWFTLNRV